jgi:hypothetical protein
MKFNNKLKKSKENLENTLGEREPLRVSVEKTQNRLESPWPPQEME